MTLEEKTDGALREALEELESYVVKLTHSLEEVQNFRAKTGSVLEDFRKEILEVAGMEKRAFNRGGELRAVVAAETFGALLRNAADTERSGGTVRNSPQIVTEAVMWADELLAQIDRTGGGP